MGSATFKADPNHPPVARLSSPVNLNNQDDWAQDYALIYLDPAQVDTDAFRTVLELYVERPSFTIPPATINGAAYSFSPTLFLAGYGDGDVRKVGPLQYFTLVQEPHGSYWETTDQNVVGENGDSGGPLFAVRSGDGSRDVIGTDSNGYNNNPYNAQTNLVNIADAQANSWISTNAVDNTRDTYWLAHHNYPEGHSDRWLGEVEYYGPCQKSQDQDCDHWFEADDNCPGTFNPSQSDSNDDNIGDACPCPCDPGVQGLYAAHQDYDGDGVCAVACSWQKADNCPKVSNPNQANCNADSEAARGYTQVGVDVLGDACDPVPCPASNADVTSTTVDNCTGNAVLGGSCIGRKIHNEIDTIGVEAHNKHFDSTMPVVTLFCSQGHNFVGDSVTSVTSEMRFCQSHVSLGFDCHAQVNISDSHLAESEPTPPQTSFVWHRVTQGACSGSCYSTLVDDPRAQTYSFDYTDKFKSIKGWDYVTDNNYWTSSNIIPPPGNYPDCTNPSYGSGTCLDGTWWSHADTDVGNSTTPTTPGGCYVDAHGDQLANHYFDLRPDATFSWSYAGIGEVQRIFLWRTLPDPFETGSVRETRFVVNTGAGQLGILHDDGTSAKIPQEGSGAIISPTLQTSLQNAGALWASAAEPSPNIGMVASRVEAVALSSDGTSTLDIALNDNGVLRSRSELGFPDFVTRDGASHPPSRTAPIAFYSSAAGGVFMLGGTDPASGIPMHDIWFRRMNDDWSPIVPLGYQPDTVLAATYSYADGGLYLLEHTPLPTDTLRLVRVDFRTGSAQTLGSCNRGSMYPTSYLTVDNDGGILVTSTSSSASIIGHLAVDANGSGYFSQVDTSEGGLVSPPIVDPNGYSFLSLYAIPGSGQSGYQTTRRSAPNYGALGTYDLCEAFPPPIVNGGFESGSLANWTANGQSETVSTASVHSGSYSAMLGSTSATNGDSTIQQTFTVPAGGGMLSFWYSNVCPDSVTYDWFTATLQTTSGQTLATIVPKTCASSSAWTQANLDLVSWAGQTLVLVLTSHDDNYPGDPTYTYVDDAAVLPPPPILNGGFEAGTLMSWTTSGQSEIVSTASVHSGSYSAMLGSTSATNGDSTIQQTFTIPASGGTLSFWYSNVCPDSVTYDWFTATLQNTSGQTLATIVPNTCASSSAWTQATLNLATWAGQTVVIVLTSHDDNYPGDPTYTYVDDIAIN